MEWIKELLTRHTKDGVVDQEGLLKEINTEFPKHAVPKSQYNTLSEAKTKLETDLTERDTQLEALKGVDAEGMQAEIARLQGENQAAKETYSKELKDLQLTNAIKLALTGKVHDEDLASQLIKRDALAISEEGKIVGLEDQLKTLQESKAFLFKQEGQGAGFKKIGNDGTNNEGGADTAISEAFGNAQ